MDKDKVTILLPALNEEAAIGRTIDEIRDKGYSKVLVIDNGSTDKTIEIAEEHFAEVYREPHCTHCGKGYVVTCGIQLVTTPYLVIMDSDYTYPSRYIEDITDLLEDYDVVIAERHIRLDNSMTLTNLLGNRFISLLGSSLFWYWTSDICTGMWGFKKEAVDKFILTSRSFELEADFFINSRKKNFKIARVPIAYRKRYGTSHLRLGHGIEISWFLIKSKFTKLSKAA